MTGPENSLNIICLDSEVFYALIKEVVERLQENHDRQDKWTHLPPLLSFLLSTI